MVDNTVSYMLFMFSLFLVATALRAFHCSSFTVVPVACCRSVGSSAVQAVVNGVYIVALRRFSKPPCLSHLLFVFSSHHGLYPVENPSRCYVVHAGKVATHARFITVYAARPAWHVFLYGVCRVLFPSHESRIRMCRSPYAYYRRAGD